VKVFHLIFLFFLISISAFAFSPAKKDTAKFLMKKILFDSSFRTDTSSLDSSVNNLNIINPAFQDESSNTYLVRLGYPILSNSLVTRIQNNDFFFSANYFKPFILDSYQNTFYETKNPFTNLTYKNLGASSTDKDECLQVIHTQNLRKNLNIGIIYNFLSSYSEINLEKSSDHCLSVFYRYTSKKYLGYSQFYFNSFTLKENGGIINDTLINYKKGNYDAEVNLNNANSYFKRMGFNTLHEIKLNALFDTKDDTLETHTKDYGSLIYNFNYETNKRTYSDIIYNDTSKFYSHYYNRKDTTKDSIIFNRLTNKILLNSPNLSKYLPNLRLALTNDLYYLKNSVPSDTIIMSKGDTLLRQKKNDFYYNVWSTVDISQEFRHILWNAAWDFYLPGGYSAGDHSIRASANMFLDSAKNIAFSVKASEEMVTPSFYYSRFLSNHIIWKDNHFIREKKQTLSATAFLKPAISASAEYFSLFNYVYFGRDAKPLQSKTPMVILALSLKSYLTLWKFNFENNITYQNNSNDTSYIHVPSLIFYNSTTFHHIIHFFTGGRLYFRLGFNLYYNNKFYPDAYMPATGAFYIQNKVKTGDYPQIDFHITLKIKTVSFFLKYSHANAGRSNSVRQFDALHYPLLPMEFSYGINWLFYD